MKRRVAPLLVAGLLSLAILPALDAQKRGDSLSSAVDAKGIRHRGSDYVGPAPWMTVDVVKKQRPRYPYAIRARQITGHGLFRVTLDMTTGSVTTVTMVQSTRVAALDESS